MTQLIKSGLPPLPSIADDKMAEILRPIYLAINSIAKQTSSGLDAAIGVSTASLTRDEIQDKRITALYTNDIKSLLVVTANESLSYGNIVAAKAVGGVLRATKYTPFNGNTTTVQTFLLGIVVEPTGMTAGVKGRIMVHDGVLSNLSGVVPGRRYFAGGAGTFTSVPDSTRWAEFPIGIGLDANNLLIRFNSVAGYQDVQSDLAS